MGIDRLYTVAEAAERLHLSQFTVRAMLADGRLGYFRVGGRAIRVSEQAIHALLERGMVPARRDVSVSR